ncbi:hypothetical protein TNIN_305321 [Trichonephila inaurata madagascariensis]|uniref:Uncharacterized protein n=1 Tax=Trichonephila inaurata madagascariensis TaxID=2747483 RepID=A0A8X6YC73_9ARAC|nr:hypothetical protein TNIN_305321 [Trichonephila inaurata madagascariensis]
MSGPHPLLYAEAAAAFHQPSRCMLTEADFLASSTVLRIKLQRWEFKKQCLFMLAYIYFKENTSRAFLFWLRFVFVRDIKISESNKDEIPIIA